MTSTTLTITMNKYYLALLAQYLYKLPEDYEHFEMGEFNSCTQTTETDHKLTKPSCGSVACAVGHALYVKGLPRVQPDGDNFFVTYCYKVFTIPRTLAGYLFNGNWDSFDNTPLGAAQRITLALTVDLEEHEFRCPWDFDRGGYEASILSKYSHFKLEDLQPYLVKPLESFPYEEIRDINEEYFLRVSKALAAGYELSQIWSVVESEGTYTYGPSYHHVNLLGYVATNEHHDGATYYEDIVGEGEDLDLDQEDEKA